MDAFAKLSDDLLLKILFNLQDDPRNWSRLACVCSKFSSLVRNTCWKSKCYSTIPALVADLLPSDSSNSAVAVPGGWSALYKLAVCCPGLLLSGVLLEHSDFGLDLDLGPEENFPRPSSSSSSSSGLLLQDSSYANLAVADCSWSLFDDLYCDTVYNVDEPSEARPAQEVGDDDTAAATAVAIVKLGTDATLLPRKRRKICRSMRSHLATGVWNLSREQGNKLLASRFRGDCLYICDWPGCVHVEEKRNYNLFRGFFKNFKRSRVWRTINDGNRKKIDVNCAFCECRQTWDLHSAFCLRRVYGFHDDGEPVVRAYVCENGHVSGAWTDLPLYT